MSKAENMIHGVINYSTQEANHLQTMINIVPYLVFYLRELNFVIENTESEISTLFSDISHKLEDRKFIQSVKLIVKKWKIVVKLSSLFL